MSENIIQKTGQSSVVADSIPEESDLNRSKFGVSSSAGIVAAEQRVDDSGVLPDI